MLRGTIVAALSLVSALCVPHPAVAATFERFYAAGADSPDAMVTGPDGAIWFTWQWGIGRLDVDGAVRLHRTEGVAPRSLTVGADRALWFVGHGPDSGPRIGRLALDGAISMLPVHDASPTVYTDIATGPDGTLWIASSKPAKVLRVALDRSAAVAAELGADRYVTSILPTPDGDVWLAASEMGFGRLTPQGEIRIVDRTEPALLTSTGLAAGPGGRVWASTSDHLLELGPAGVTARVRADGPDALAIGPDGALWFAESTRIVRVDPRTLHREHFDNPFGSASDCGPDTAQYLLSGGVAFSRDGALWVPDLRGSFLRVGPAGSARSPLQPVLARTSAIGVPNALATGRGGTLWVAGTRGLAAVRPDGRRRVFDVGGVSALARGLGDRVRFAPEGAIKEIDPEGRVRVLARLPAATSVSAMARALDGSTWFTDFGRRVGRVNRAGRLRDVVRGLPRSTRLRDVAVAADGAVWLTDAAGAILRRDRRGRLRRFTLPRGARPTSIAEGRDGAMWFTDFGRRRVGRVTARGLGREVPVSDRPLAIVSGSDGAIWVTTLGGSGDNGLVRVSTDGAAREFFVRQACRGSSQGLLAAPDGSLWFTDSRGPVSVGRLELRLLERTGQFAD